MKKLLLSFLFFVSIVAARADEGMWLPMLLGKQVYADMVKKGLKLTPDQLYSINHNSIKDAIIIFGGGCTGEIVSDKGLIFTNHHCGYDAIATASTVEHNYLKNGFYAASFQQEIPTKLTVQFLEKIEDVTPLIMSEIKGMSWADRTKAMPDIYKKITSKYVDTANGLSARIYSMFKGNQYLVYVFKIYKDIRLVGTPPESIGKFGGDTDNWEWPRHTGDFSIFRVYTSSTGKPTAYDAANVPLKPKKYLPVSIKGFKDGDYAMIFGYPGSTNRYEVSEGVTLKTDIENPAIVKLRGMRLMYMFEEMKKSEATKLKLASNYAGIANYWKFFDGEARQLKKLHVADAKKLFEDTFQTWANNKPEYKDVLSKYSTNFSAWKPYTKHRVYINEGVLGSPLAAFAASLQQVEMTLEKPNITTDDIKKALNNANNYRNAFIESEDIPSDRNIVAATAQLFYTDIDASQQPKSFYTNLSNQYGALDDEGTYKKWAFNMFKNTFILDSVRWNNFVQNPSLDTLRKDPAYQYASSFVKNYADNYAPYFTTFTNTNAELGNAYVRGIMQMNPTKVSTMYPDANFSMRVSYGNVKSYKPRDAVYYDYVTTAKGLLEKYVPGDYEFDLPTKAVQLIKNRDFGPYKDKLRNDLVTCFITTNDITGGNSGSPVMDGYGNLIGLAFDGNYEALSHKIAFDKALNRTICVDVRYVLWCIDILGGAKNIVNELTLVK